MRSELSKICHAITGPPNGPLLFCTLSSVVVVGRRCLSSSVTRVGGRPLPGRARGLCGCRHCTAGQYGYGWEDRNKDARVNTADDSSAFDKNFVNFGPVTPEFCGRLCAGRDTRWALPRISSVLYVCCYTALSHRFIIYHVATR